MASGFAGLFGSCYAVQLEQQEWLPETPDSRADAAAAPDSRRGDAGLGRSKRHGSLDRGAAKRGAWDEIRDLSSFLMGHELPPRTSTIASKRQQIIVFDWDDTLLCTSFLLSLGDADGLPERVSLELMELAQAVKELLQLAKALGTVYIITNAVEGWVEQSALRYLPAIWPALEGVRRVSARALFERQLPGLQSAWKRHAFLALRQNLDANTPVDLVAVGDMPFEIMAAKALGRRLRHARVKTIKFRSNPSPAELLKEVKFMALQLPRIINSPDNLQLYAK